MGSVAPPGWYSDPGGQPVWRWWSGSAWTEFTAPISPGFPVARRLDPARAVADERGMARWARIFLVVQALIAPAMLLLFWRFFRAFGGFAAMVESSPQGEVPGFPLEFVQLFHIQLGIQAVNVFSLACTVVLAIWFHRAATAAASLGIPARHSPGWATGSWFIPVLNLWWPCEAACDFFPPEHAMRRRVVGLWVTGLVAGVVTSAGFMAVMFGAILAIPELAEITVARVPTAVMALSIVGPLTTAAVLIASRGVVSAALAEHETILALQRDPAQTV